MFAVSIPTDLSLPAHPASSPPNLGEARRGYRGRIRALRPEAASSELPVDELERRLIEMGFVEGASVELLHHGPFGRDPIAVRVDGATMAIRRREARAILIAPSE